MVTDLATLANLAEIFGALTVVGGVLFALVQLRHLQRQRLDQAAINLVHSVQNPGFIRAMSLIRGLPEDAAVEARRMERSTLAAAEVA